MKRVYVCWPRAGVLVLIWTGFVCLPLQAAEETQAAVSGSFTNFAAKFPAAVWRAGDAYFKRLGQSGHSMEFKAFINDNKAVVRSVKANPQKRWVGSLKLSDETEPDDYWILDFTYQDGKWHTLTGTKFFG